MGDEKKMHGVLDSNLQMWNAFVLFHAILYPSRVWFKYEGEMRDVAPHVLAGGPGALQCLAWDVEDYRGHVYDVSLMGKVRPIQRPWFMGGGYVSPDPHQPGIHIAV